MIAPSEFKDWFIYDIDPEANYVRNAEVTTAFSFANIQVINYFVVLRTQYTVVAVAYSIGRPFRQSLRRRYLLVAALIITGLSSTFMLLL